MILKKGDIVWVEIPEADDENPTHVQKNFRPALVIQKNINPNNSIITLITFTKVMSAINYQPSIEVKRSLTNGLECDSILLIFQMGAFDKRQITRKLGQLESVYLKETDKLIREMLGY